MKITITINTGNAAFEDDTDGEVSRILARVVDDWRAIRADRSAKLRDNNGNTVGTLTVTGK